MKTYWEKVFKYQTKEVMVFGGQELDPDNIRKVEVVEIMKRETD